jgi:hypothetical protein
MNAITYCFVTGGNANFIRDVANAMESTISDFYSGEKWFQDSTYFGRVPPLQLDKTVKALGVVEVAGVFAIFVVSQFAANIFDEIYDRTLKRPIDIFLDKVFTRGSSTETRKLEFRDVIYLEDIDTVVVVRAKISKENAAQATPLILQAHRIAHTYILQHGRQAPVHCHTIEDGKINVEPKLYLSIKLLDREREMQ